MVFDFFRLTCGVLAALADRTFYAVSACPAVFADPRSSRGCLLAGTGSHYSPNLLEGYREAWTGTR